jgi:hypothetical protein
MGCGADINANALLTALIAGKDFTIPEVDLDDPIYNLPDADPLDPPDPLTNALLTEKLVTGNGTFDVIMQAINNQLAFQFEKSRITGAEYAKVYMEALGQALAGAISYLTSKDTAYWQAVQAQAQAEIARVQLVESRVNLVTAKTRLAIAQLEAANQEANYALTKMKLSTEDVTYCTAQYNLDNILPKQASLLDEQIAAAAYNVEHILPTQKSLLTEQMESQRANTSNTRSDGVTAVVGLIGKQKDLYTQQITSYQRDAEVKVTKLFTDAWITQKTIDEGLLPPVEFANASLDAILGDLKANVGLG